MANIIQMPQFGLSEESAVLTAWHIKAGDAVAPGDKLFSIETGKTTFDVESEFSGVILALMAGEGDEIAVKTPVCAIGEAGERFEAPVEAKPTAPSTASGAITPVPAPAVPEAAGSAAVPGAAGSSAGTMAAHTAPSSAAPYHPGVSPRARKLAEKLELNPLSATPTGAEGRVIERDILALLDAPPPPAAIAKGPAAVDLQPLAPEPAGYEDIPLSNMRKVIARNMTTSLRNSAQLTHTASFDATNIMECRALLKKDETFSDISLTDMVLYAVSRTLPAFPALNAWLTGDTMRVFEDVNLACAVDTERGLMAPVIFGASKMSLPEISLALKTLAGQCRNGSITPDLLSGGSFTVSNLGQFGIESFTPILNPPQTGILGVNTITQRIRETDGVIKTYPSMALSLTYDHRALDGAPASRFLQTLCGNLERFVRLLAE